MQAAQIAAYTVYHELQRMQVPCQRATTVSRFAKFLLCSLLREARESSDVQFRRSALPSLNKGRVVHADRARKPLQGQGLHYWCLI